MQMQIAIYSKTENGSQPEVKFLCLSLKTMTCVNAWIALQIEDCNCLYNSFALIVNYYIHGCKIPVALLILT